MLHVYPTGAADGSLIGQLYLNEQSEDTKNTTPTAGITTIILLDVSGSMGQNVGRIVTQYLPECLTRAGYQPEDPIQVVTFSSDSRQYTTTVGGLATSKIRSRGCTYMSPGIQNVGDLIQSSSFQKIRLLTLSDGMLHDQNRAMKTAQQLASQVKDKYQISSVAIRFKTNSYGDIDTRGLSSMLQLGNCEYKQEVIVDIDAYDKPENIINILTELLDDRLGMHYELKADRPIFLSTPWSEAKDRLLLVPGQNTFWLQGMLESGSINQSSQMELIVGGQSAPVSVDLIPGEKLDLSSYQTVLKEKTNYFLKRIRILKVVNTPEALAEIASIVSYFSQLEKTLSLNEVLDSQEIDHTLQSRLTFFKHMAKKKKLSVSIQMAELANDDRVGQLNSAQQADYLRSTSLSANAKSLARRALKQGLDFDQVAIREVRTMKAHLTELADLDDQNHYVSFYSQETTLSGIRTVCQLDDDQGTLEEMSALTILQLLNIVGLPATGPIGDFPDPKTYHLTKLFLGTTASLADVMTVRQQGMVLEDPFTKQEITNVVPFYDDDRIQQFLMKYAPTLLEYMASLGMRNMLLEVPHTYKYTVVSGVWNLAHRIDQEKTNKNIDVFTKLVKTYAMAVNGLFDDVPPLMKEQSIEDQAQNRSFYIANNGTTNMISPMITVMEEASRNDWHRAQFMPAVLRALYSFEFYQMIRKFFRSDDDKLAKRKEMLHRILGIDVEKHPSPLPAMFTKAVSQPAHHDQPEINQTELQKIIDQVFWIDKITLLPELLRNSFLGIEGQQAIAQLPQATADNCQTALNIDFDLKTFKFYCIIQSFLFCSKASRVDDQLKKMKIEDCSHQSQMEKMVRDYIRTQYRADWQSRLAKQEQEERRVLAEELALEMAVGADQVEFKRLFNEGMSRNHISVKIYDTYQLGYVQLKDYLFNPELPVINRQEKLYLLMMGTNRIGRVVWNKGNTLRLPRSELDQLFNQVDLGDWWQGSLVNEWKAKCIYLYRESDEANRHTHCNSKPSFWARGYPNILAYFADISEDEKQQYLREHNGCCGIDNGVVVKPF